MRWRHGLHVRSSYTGGCAELCIWNCQSFTWVTQSYTGILTTQSCTGILTTHCRMRLHIAAWGYTLLHETTHWYVRLNIDTWGYTCSFTWGHTLMHKASYTLGNMRLYTSTTWKSTNMILYTLPHRITIILYTVGYMNIYTGDKINRFMILQIYCYMRGYTRVYTLIFFLGKGKSPEDCINIKILVFSSAHEYTIPSYNRLCCRL